MNRLSRSEHKPENPDPGLKRLDLFHDIAPRRLRQAFAILLAGLVVTLIASLYIKQELETAARNEFNFISNEIQLNIADRLNANALVLYSGAALFYASDAVSRAEWQLFTSNLRIEEQMPGTQGIGFSLLIPPEQLDQHIQQIRQEGFSDYTIRPEGVREIYSSIIYLEPFTGRNLRAFGYDMFSEPVRRAAMERARDENSAALSAKVILVQETEEDVQPGILMYVPVYRHEQVLETVAERREAIIGWVYSPYRMKDLMRGTLGNYELNQGDRNIILQIYDGDSVSEEALLYDSRDLTDRDSAFTPLDYTKVNPVTLYGRPWTIRYTLMGGLSSITNYGSFWLFLIGGSSISLLVFGLTISLLRTAHYLESIRLLAETDSLTGLLNRRKILELAEYELLRAKRQQRPMTLLMIDLNFFKEINDGFGHVIGDQVLRMTANAIQKPLRKDIDRVGRFGGDEFLIILPELNLMQVEMIATRLRTSVASDTQNIAAGVQPVSLSIGAAQLDETTCSLDELIERADHAMYADKKLAKNHLD